MDSGDSRSTTPSWANWMAAAKDNFLLYPFLLRILDKEKPGIDCRTSFTVHEPSFHRLTSGLKWISISKKHKFYHY